MRKQKKMILWPVYFDLSRTRKQGRKVPKSAAVLTPNLAEVQEAAENLGLKPETEANVAHPASPWQRTGRIWVEKKRTKVETLTRIGREIGVIRQRARK